MSLINILLRNSADLRFRPIPTSKRYLSSSFEHRKKPSRGGQNLAERYKRLEKSLRGKEAYTSESDELKHSTLTGPSTGTGRTIEPKTELFHGLTIPHKPKEPADDECCMSGCAVCVYDLYEESLGLYKEALAKVTATLTSMGVPEVEWPTSIRSSTAAMSTGKKKDVALSAFEEMERRLAEKSQKVNAVDAIAKEQNPVLTELEFKVLNKKPRKKQPWNLPEFHEGLRWILFPNR